MFEVVPNAAQSRVSTKWVITEKIKNEKNVVKARLVARGFEENLNKDTRTDSPTCSKQSLRLCFVTASIMSWELYSLDVTSAFLQDNLIERDVFVQPPVEWNGHPSIWKLRIQTLIGMIVSHVDDFVYCGTVVWHEKVIHSLFRTFDIRETHCGSFKYIGLNVIQTDEGIIIDQQMYVNELEAIDISSERSKQRDAPLTSEEKARLRSVSGQLLWASTQTRVDSAFDAFIQQ